MKVILWTFTHEWYDSSSNYYGTGGSRRTHTQQVVSDINCTQEEVMAQLAHDLKKIEAVSLRQGWHYVEYKEFEILLSKTSLPFPS